MDAVLVENENTGEAVLGMQGPPHGTGDYLDTAETTGEKAATFAVGLFFAAIILFLAVGLVAVAGVAAVIEKAVKVVR